MPVPLPALAPLGREDLWRKRVLSINVTRANLGPGETHSRCTLIVISTRPPGHSHHKHHRRHPLLLASTTSTAKRRMTARNVAETVVSATRCAS